MRWDQLFSRWVALFCLPCLVASSSVWGSFTTINPPAAGEDTHQQIFSQIYQQEGGNFTPFGTRGVDFANNSLIAFRVDDQINRGEGGPTEMGGPTGVDDTDQLWQAMFTGATAEAKFAAYQQSFGYFDGASGGSFTQLFQLIGDRYNVQGEANISSLAGRTLRWGRGGGPVFPSGQPRIVSSLNADNPDNFDHMVTYQILERGRGGVAPLRWVILFEDILQGEPFADFDFNDLVVEINAIPEPATISAAGLLCLLGLRRRRRT